MDNNPIIAQPPHKVAPAQPQKAQKETQEPIKEIKDIPKVRGNWLQNLLRAKYFKVSMTIFLMFLIFGTALLIALRTEGPEKPVSAENIGIIPEATIIFPEEEEVEISTQSSEIEPKEIPSAI